MDFQHIVREAIRMEQQRRPVSEIQQHMRNSGVKEEMIPLMLNQVEDVTGKMKNAKMRMIVGPLLFSIGLGISLLGVVIAYGAVAGGLIYAISGWNMWRQTAGYR